MIILITRWAVAIMLQTLVWYVKTSQDTFNGLLGSTVDIYLSSIDGRCQARGGSNRWKQSCRNSAAVYWNTAVDKLRIKDRAVQAAQSMQRAAGQSKQFERHWQQVSECTDRSVLL